MWKVTTWNVQLSVIVCHASEIPGKFFPKKTIFYRRLPINDTSIKKKKKRDAFDIPFVNQAPEFQKIFVFFAERWKNRQIEDFYVNDAEKYCRSGNANRVEKFPCRGNIASGRIRKNTRLFYASDTSRAFMRAARPFVVASLRISREQVIQVRDWRTASEGG